MNRVSPGSLICHAPQHLAHDHLDVLVVDLHALQPVDVLHLVADVARERLDAEQTQDVVRIGRAVDDHLALVHHLAVVRHHVLVLGDQVLVRGAVEIGDDETLLALGVLAERNRAGHLGQHAGVLGRARLEQLRDPRQTAGDVARLRGFLRNPRQHFAHADFLAVAHRDDRADLERDVDRLVGARHLDLVAGLVDQLHLRAQALRLDAAAALGIDHHQRREAGDLVDLARHRDAFLHVLEAARAPRIR